MERKLDQCDIDYDFPFECTLSLTNVIGYWQVMTNHDDPFKSMTAREVVKRVEDAPELLKPIKDINVIEKHRETVNLIMSAIVSPFSQEEEMLNIMTPFKREDVYSTKSFQQLMEQAGGHDALMDPEEMVEIMRHKVMAAYVAIMETYYGVTIELDRHVVYTLQNARTGLKRFYKIDINPKFCEIKLKKDLPELQEAELNFLVNNIYNLDVWMDLLPPDVFEFQGIIVFKLTDITTEEVLSRIKENLLNKDSILDQKGFETLEGMFKSLMQLSDMKLGIAAYEKSKGTFINFGNRVKRSILLGKHSDLTCPVTNETLFERFSHNPEPMVVEDLRNCAAEMGGYEEEMISDGIRNLILSPLFYNGEFVGLLELASPNRGDLNALALSKIKNVLPLFAVAVKRSSEDLESSIQSMIKEKYTSIHPTVEWKFVDAAYNMLEQKENGQMPVTPPIVFKNVYPLYAASDIRNSSVERNLAINQDLKKQLDLCRKVLDKARTITNLPILDETIFRLDKFRKKIKSKLVTGDESAILEFIQKEVEPILRNIESNHPEIKPHAQEYWSSLSDNFGVVYERRKAFEESLTIINDTIGHILDDEEVKAQKMFPHFFEKYKTDGVEHNIYIGAELVEKLKFDEVYLRNIRLWQLVVMAEVANRTAAIIPDLPLPLETTHLILVHSNPLSIRFRMEEKKFDVDGAYNIRYEITKKRIDKANVKDTDERITQPGKIAIIYSQEKDAVEYRRYLAYLKSKKLLTGEIEDLELEELQGVSGLRALRIAVNIEAPSIIDEVNKILEVV